MGVDDDSVSHLFNLLKMDDIHMSEEDTSEYESDSSFDFQVHKMMIIFLMLVIIVPERHFTNYVNLVPRLFLGRR